MSELSYLIKIKDRRWNIKTQILYASFLFYLCGCGSLLCTKANTNQGLLFHYGSFYGIDRVDIGSEPTHKQSDKWVKTLIVKEEGFLLITGQNMLHCDNEEEIKKNAHIPCKGHKVVESYQIRRYTNNTGYEEWSYDSIPKKEWSRVKNLYHSFSKKPDYHYENCRYKAFGQIYQILQIIQRA